MSEQTLPASQVQVVLSDCPAADARRLFDVLSGRFASDRGPEDQPQETEENRPKVWTGTFDTSHAVAGVRAPEAELSAPVTADVQGGHLAVKLLREALAEVFTVHELGGDAGDQEIQVQLRLDSKPSRESRSA
ncbi:hypothetical protein ACFYS7_17125 [Streptomyces avermitilis]|uniref:hypothetical protein n=1 Tax=Streptomyces avermitilis TaxID=33903 RepID=UPI0033BF6C48